MRPVCLQLAGSVRLLVARIDGQGSVSWCHASEPVLLKSSLLPNLHLTRQHLEKVICRMLRSMIDRNSDRLFQSENLRLARPKCSQ